MTRITRSEDETIAVAREFASTLSAGDVVLLSGTLGAGKTAFVRGLAQGLGINPDDVSSPTFTIVHEYREMGVEDGVLAIEWPDRLTHALPGAREVEIELVDEQTRRIRAG
jgi:tRNA threonylcarbamoyladenosine biosynthesis protein TsaE